MNIFSFRSVFFSFTFFWWMCHAHEIMYWWIYSLLSLDFPPCKWFFFFVFPLSSQCGCLVCEVSSCFENIFFFGFCCCFWDFLTWSTFFFKQNTKLDVTKQMNEFSSEVCGERARAKKSDRLERKYAVKRHSLCKVKCRESKRARKRISDSERMSGDDPEWRKRQTDSERETEKEKNGK